MIRIFDALNDFRNIKTALEATKKYANKRTVASGCISYTQSPVHTWPSMWRCARSSRPWALTPSA